MPPRLAPGKWRAGVTGFSRRASRGSSTRNISANLANITANWRDICRYQRVFASNLGVYPSRDLDGGTWTLLGAAGSRAAHPVPNGNWHFGLASQVGAGSAPGHCSDGVCCRRPSSRWRSASA
jgi:hypothetical protein